MRPKRRLKYRVSCEGYWFEFKNFRASSKTFNTIKRSSDVAISLKNKYPDKKVVIEKIRIKKNTRLSCLLEIR
jgi:hypothetical protein